MTNPRGATSQNELDIHWDYPLYAMAAETGTDRTTTTFSTNALTEAAAFAYISGADRRPLLVLRECKTCTGTDDALLTRKADNEKTMLMSRWFHCVKLPPDVLQDDHPFHKLFGRDAPPHLFISEWNGAARRDLNGQQSRTELWAHMEQMLATEYAQTHEPALKELFVILNSLDGLDSKIGALQKRVDQEIEKDGPKSPKVAKIQKEITSLCDERSELRQRAEKVSRLKLKQEGPQEAQAGVGPKEKA